MNTNDSYYEVTIKCEEIVSEALCTFLLENGALGAVENDTFRNKNSFSIRAYFADEQSFLNIRDALKDYLKKLKENFGDFKSYKITRKSLAGKNYQDAHKKYFKPIKISKRIVVKPDYEHYNKKPHENVIEINPNMAFGIGSHETTKMCIQYIDKLLEAADDATGLRILDAGTGTAILAIAAAKLGAKNIYGFDIDDVACEIAKENVLINGVADSVKIACHPIDKVKDKYDLVIANILSHILLSMKDELKRVVKRGGKLILSGILISQATGIIDGFTKIGFSLISKKEDGEWTALRLKR
ncbi:50S ribosomal protein L11 methyltransferase [Thermodesulfobacteriota bacterium]